MSIQILSEGYRFRKGTGTPFTTTGRQYCAECKDEVYSVTRYYYQGSVYGYKEWCRGCGRVLAGGIHYHTSSLGELPNRTFYKAVDWMKRREEKG
jgi:hypothetical protein